jgi:hypothetical protein
MSKAKRKPGNSARRRPAQQPAAKESQTAEVATVAWAVTVTMVAVCDVIAIGAHLYALSNPASKVAAALGGLMLLAGAMIGAGTFALTPVVYRLRRTPPPTGFAVFAACAAAAPMLALVARALQ